MLLFPPTVFAAQTVTLDTTFNPGTGFTTGGVLDVAVQTDGKIAAVGNFQDFNGASQPSIARLNSDGTLDSSLTSIAGTSSEMDQVIALTGGKLYVSGRNQGPIKGVIRLNADGTADSSFNVGTGASGGNVFAMTTQSDGKVVIAGGFTLFNGTSRSRVARVNSNGTLDTSFDPGTGLDSTVFSVAVSGSGKVVLGGAFTTCNGVPRNRIAQLNADGSLDTSFNPGTGADGSVWAVAVQSDGKVIAGGDFTSINGTTANRIVRFNTDGTLDSTFNIGAGADASVKKILVLSDGKILLAGSFSSVAGVSRNRVARLNSDGSIDSTFTTGAGPDGTVYAMTVQSDGKIVIGGFFTTVDGVSRSGIARLSVAVPNSAPTLTTVSTLTGASALVPFTISYAMLAAAADEADANGDTLSFRVESINSGTLTKNGSAVSPGSTLLGSGESLVWTPPSNSSGTVNAFSIVAYDGSAPSASAVAVPVQVTGSTGFPLSENFNGKTTADLTAAGWLISGSATVVSDKLRLTEAVNNQSGAGIYNRAFSSSLGINVQFDYFMGNGTFSDKADGLTFFLVDGSQANPTAGPPGGSLGYIYADNVLPGASKAYIGVAFDRFGNFLNTAGFHDGDGFNTSRGPNPNTIAIRGPSSANDSKRANAEYEYVVGSKVGFLVEGNRKVNLTIKNNGTITLKISGDGGATWTTIYDNFNFEGTSAYNGYSRPATFKLGIAASTGALNNEHSIDNLAVTVPVDLAVAFASAPSGTQSVGASVSYTVTVTNHGPNADSAAQFSYTVPNGISGVSWNYSISGGGGSGSGSGTGNSISASLNLPSGAVATFNVSGTIAASAAGQTLTHTATATPSSGFGDSNLANNTASTTTTVRSNSAPTLTSVSALSGATEDTAFAIGYATLAAAANEADVDGDTLSFRIESVTSGTLTKGGIAVAPGSTLLGPGETLSWTPAANANGTLGAFQVKAWDGEFASASAVPVQISVAAVNDAPALGSISDQTILEDASQQSVVLGGIGSGANNESQTLSVSAASSNPGLVPHPTINYSSPTDSAVLTYQPLPNANGTATITVTVSDDGKTANGGVNSFSRTFTVTVTPVNDAPTLAAIPAAAILEDAGEQTIALSGIGAGAANETQTLTVTATSSNPSLIPDPSVSFSSPNGTGSLRYTPMADANGTATITVTVADDGGTANGGVNFTTRTFVVAVMPVNDPPRIDSPPGLIFFEDSVNAYGIALTGISAGPANENQRIFVSVSAENPSLFSEVAFNYASPESTASVSFRGAANANGVTRIFVSVHDDGGVENGGVNATSTSFEVRILPMNDAPTLTRINALSGAAEDQPFTISHSTLAGASDAADVEGHELSFQIDAVLAGALTIDGGEVVPGQTILRPGGNLIWTPPANASGAMNAFAVRAFDGALASAEAVAVSVVVAPVNDAPTVRAIADQSVEEDGVLLVALAAADLETRAEQLKVQILSSNTNLVTAENVLLPHDRSSFAIAPLANQHGTAAITVVITDAEGAQASTTFQLTVRPVNDVPVLSSLRTIEGAREDEAFTVSHAALLAASDAADADGDAIRFKIESVLNGTLLAEGIPVIPGRTMIERETSLLWIAPTNTAGTLEAFTVRADDGTVSSPGTAAVSITVAAVNDPPVIADIASQIANEDTAVALRLSVSDAEDSLESLELTFESSNTNLVESAGLTLLKTETPWLLQIAPRQNQFGATTIAVTARDSGGLSASRSVRVLFLPVNDPPAIGPIEVLTNATMGLPFEIGHALLGAAANVADVDGDPISFQVDQVFSGVLTSGETSLTTGAVLSTNAPWMWLPETNGVVAAFSVRAFDGALASTNAAVVRVEVRPAIFANAKIVASDGRTKELFGYAVATEGNRVLVGAPQATSVRGESTGAAYWFVRSGTNWVEQGKLVARDGVTGEQFGSAVAIAPKTIVIGAQQAKVAGNTAAGAVYVFDQSGTNWVQQTRLTASDAAEFARFGSSVALSGDTLVVGAPQAVVNGFDSAGAAYVFVRRGTNWVEEAKLIADRPAPQDWFGLVASISSDTIVVGALLEDLAEKKDAGAVYVFRRSGATWTRQARLTAEDARELDRFGSAVSIFENRVAVGALLADSTAGRDAGAVYLFRREGETWAPEAKLTALDGRADEWFGAAVSLGRDAVLIGATQGSAFGKRFAGAAYKFLWDGKSWTQQPRLLARDHEVADRYGSAVALSGETAVLGTYLSDPAGKIDAGAAYLFAPENASAEPAIPANDPPVRLELETRSIRQTHTVSRVGGDCSCLVSLSSAPASAVRIVVSGPVGQTIQLQQSSDMVLWQTITNVVLTSLPTEYVEQSSSGSPAKFYRVVASPGGGL